MSSTSHTKCRCGHGRRVHLNGVRLDGVKVPDPTDQSCRACDCPTYDPIGAKRG